MSAILYIEIKKQGECINGKVQFNAFVEFIVRKKTAKNGSKFKTYFPFVVFFGAIIIYYEATFITFPI